MMGVGDVQRIYSDQMHVARRQGYDRTAGHERALAETRRIVGLDAFGAWRTYSGRMVARRSPGKTLDEWLLALDRAPFRADYRRRRRVTPST